MLGEAYGLPLNFIPSEEATRSAASSMVTLMLFIGPYLLSIFDRLSSEISCPA
jgi:hypothetical protein